MEDDKYPHWKDALFGNNDAVANIRCAVHYVFWHSIYAAIGVVGVIGVSIAKVALTVGAYLGPLAEPIESVVTSVLSGINYVLNHRYTEKLFEVAFVLFGVASMLWFIGMTVWLILNQPIKFLSVLAMIIGLIIVVGVTTAIYEKLRNPAKSAATSAAQSARSAGEKATKTPGIRRVYGECPVDIKNQPPKWFDEMFNEEK